MGAPATFRPVEHRKVYELVADQLIAHIGSHQLRSGAALPSERELTERFGVGRSSIREALRMLESQGVIANAYRGTFVVARAANPLNSSLQLVVALDQATRISDVFELRLALDCEAAALAAGRRTGEQLARMQQAIDEMEQALPSHGEAFVAADVRFHLDVAEATGNRLLLYATEAARELIRRTLLSVVEIPSSSESAVSEHRAIYQAIAKGDSVGARAAMRAHLERVERDAEEGLVDG